MLAPKVRGTPRRNMIYYLVNDWILLLAFGADEDYDGDGGLSKLERPDFHVDTTVLAVVIVFAVAI